MRWIDALKEWNTGSGKWCIPKKGTEAYDAVRALMGEKEPKAKAPKAEKAPKEAKAPKASLQDMAAAVGVPMKQMKASAADYYKRVDNADPESRALLMERMPAQLRAGWEKHLASKAPKDAPAVRRVLKKKPVMVAVPEAPPAPAPAMKIPMERQRKAFSDSMAPKIAMSPPPPAFKPYALDFKNKSPERLDLEHRVSVAYNTVRRYYDPSHDDLYKLQQKKSRDQIMRDVDIMNIAMPDDVIPDVLLKYWYKTPEGKRYLLEEKQKALEAPAPAVRRVIKKPVKVAEKPEAPAVKETRDMRNRRIDGEERERYGKEQTVRALNNLNTYWRDMGEGREKKSSSFKKGVLADVETALLHYPRDSIPEYAMKMYLKTEKGKNMLTQPEGPKRFKKRGGSIA